MLVVVAIVVTISVICGQEMLSIYTKLKNINDVIIPVSKILGNILLKIFNLSSFVHDSSGPTPITNIAGTIIGITVEL